MIVTPHVSYTDDSIILLRNGFYILEMFLYKKNILEILAVEWGEELYLCLPNNNAK
jgi:hypothetical protein